MSQTQEIINGITKDQSIHVFEKILELAEQLPLQHDKFCAVEDVLNELISIMPDEWVSKNIKSKD